MARYIRSEWTPRFWLIKDKIHSFAILTLLSDSLIQFQDSWPTLQDYQCLIDKFSDGLGDNLGQALYSRGGARLKIVPQADKPEHFEQHYAPRIYLTGEIQTRTQNWHDFFQIVTWLLFPKTKAAINELQYLAIRQRFNNNGPFDRRSPIENLLSLFDECGAILIFENNDYAKFVQHHEWKKLFWDNRDKLKTEFECVVFGHALYEKLFNPYVGMTANAILLHCKAGYFTKPMQQRIKIIDDQIANMLLQQEQLTQPSDLSPFPLLGMPGWYPDTQYESFYNDRSYFRPRQ